jgi:putative SOS response-associated peptidase YedK
MCGRYVTPEESEAERYLTVHLLHWHFERSYNVAPSQSVPVFCSIAPETPHPEEVCTTRPAEGPIKEVNHGQRHRSRRAAAQTLRARAADP